MTLDSDDIEAVARRVAELLRTSTGATEPLVDAAELARILGVDRDWVYARANRLGAVRLGDGPKARLRFDLERVRATLAETGTGGQAPCDELPRPARTPTQTCWRSGRAAHTGQVQSVTCGHERLPRWLALGRLDVIPTERSQTRRESACVPSPTPCNTHAGNSATRRGLSLWPQKGTG